MLLRVFPQLRAVPIVQGPIPTTPSLVAASRACRVLGTLAGAYMSPDRIVEELYEVHRLTPLSCRGIPFAFNTFASEGYEDVGVSGDTTAMTDAIHKAYVAMGHTTTPVPLCPPPVACPLAAQLEAVLSVPLEMRPRVFWFTFGVCEESVMEMMKKDGMVVLGTATTISEALILHNAGVDGVVCQGREAGGHRATFASTMEEGMSRSARELTRCVRDALPAKVMVLGAGGMTTGGDVRRFLQDTNACGVVLGTAFLRCKECPVPEAHKRALEGGSNTTVVTRAFSGRHARMVPNCFTESVEGIPIPPFSIQNAWTQGMRKIATEAMNSEYIPLYAGTAHAANRGRPVTVSETIQLVVREYEEC